MILVNFVGFLGSFVGVLSEWGGMNLFLIHNCKNIIFNLKDKNISPVYKKNGQQLKVNFKGTNGDKKTVPTSQVFPAKKRKFLPKICLDQLLQLPVQQAEPKLNELTKYRRHTPSEWSQQWNR